MFTFYSAHRQTLSRLFFFILFRNVLSYNFVLSSLILCIYFCLDEQTSSHKVLNNCTFCVHKLILYLCVYRIYMYIVSHFMSFFVHLYYTNPNPSSSDTAMLFLSSIGDKVYKLYLKISKLHYVVSTQYNYVVLK